MEEMPTGNGYPAGKRRAVGKSAALKASSRRATLALERSLRETDREKLRKDWWECPY